MKVKILALQTIVVLQLFFSCKHLGSSNHEAFLDTANGKFIKDIPLTTAGEPPFRYRQKSSFEKKLGIRSLENGVDSIEIRLFYGDTSRYTGKFVDFKNVGGKWASELCHLKYNNGLSYNLRRDSLYSIVKNCYHPEPKSGWDSFISQITDLQITSLPDYHVSGNYPSSTEGDYIVTVEIATRRYYRWYTVVLPDSYEKDVKDDTNQMEKILDLIKSEFSF